MRKKGVMDKKGVEIQFLMIMIFLLAILLVILGIIALGKESMLEKLGIIGNILRFGG